MMRGMMVASAMALAVAMGSVAQGATVVRDVAIVNAGFEAQQLGDGQYTNNDLTGWMVVGGTALAGAQNPLATSLPAIPEGQNVAYLNAFRDQGGVTEGYFFQTLGEYVTAGTQYRLTAEIGRRFDAPNLPRFTAELTVGGEAVALAFLTNQNVPLGGFSTLTIDYVGAADVSGPLGIRFRSFYDPAQGTEDYQASIDALRLTATSEDVAGAVPEPASWAMMVGGFGLLGGTLRRRQETRATFA